MFEWTREDLIRSGRLVPHPELHAQYRDGVPGPAKQQPWRKDQPTLELDVAGLYWAGRDVMDVVALEYGGQPPSQGAALTGLRHSLVESARLTFFRPQPPRTPQVPW